MPLLLTQMGDNVGPKNNTELIFCAVVLIIGACFMAAVVGNMAVLVSNLNATTARNSINKERACDAVRYLAMPKDVQERVQEYYDHVSCLSHPGERLPLPMRRCIFGCTLWI